MNKKSVFLLQAIKEQNDELKKNFANENDYEVCGCAVDGMSAILMIKEKKPDFLITELVLAGYDGLSIISKIKELNLPTKIIVLSSLMSEEVISKAVGAGADYFLAKPINFSLLIERMQSLESQGKNLSKDFGEGIKGMSLAERVSKIFINVGIPPHIKGYSFLREGVIMAIRDPKIISNITKRLYPLIGEKFETSASKVERAIRHAIEVAWNRGRIDNINSILGVRAFMSAEKPTNGEFIALIADKMLLENA